MARHYAALLQVRILYSHSPAGAHPSGYIGEDPRGKPGNLLPLLAQMAVGKYREGGLKVFGNDYPTPDGTCVRDYIHILDLAEGHLNAMVALDDDSKFVNVDEDGKYRAFNLGKGVGMSVLNMVEAMRKVTGYEFPFTIVGRRAGDVPDLTADPTLAEKELGFKASRSLDDMVRLFANAVARPLELAEEEPQRLRLVVPLIRS